MYLHLLEYNMEPNTTVCSEFYKFLNSGTCSQALNHFLQKDLYDTKMLQQMEDVRIKQARPAH